MVDVTCETNDLIQMVEFICDTNDPMVDTEIESYNILLINISFIQDESQEEARSTTKNNISETKLEFYFNVTK